MRINGIFKNLEDLHRTVLVALSGIQVNMKETGNIKVYNKDKISKINGEHSGAHHFFVFSSDLS